MGDQAVLVTGVLYLTDDNEFESRYEIRRFQSGEPVFCAWCAAQSGSPGPEYTDLADCTLRCRLNTEHYMRPLESLVSHDVVEHDLDSSMVLKFFRPAFHIAPDDLALNYQEGSLFHLVLPHNYLPVNMEFDPLPTYGWPKNDRFVLGWQQPLGETCNFVFAKVASDEFGERAKDVRDQIKIRSREEHVDQIGVQVERVETVETVTTEEIAEALLDAFISQKDLARVVEFAELDKSLAEIAADSNLDDVAFDLVVWAKKHQKVAQLLRTAYRRNNTNDKLRSVVEAYCGELPEST